MSAKADIWIPRKVREDLLRTWYLLVLDFDGSRCLAPSVTQLHVPTEFLVAKVGSICRKRVRTNIALLVSRLSADSVCTKYIDGPLLSS